MRHAFLVIFLIILCNVSAPAATLINLDVRDGTERSRELHLTFDQPVDAAVLTEALSLEPHLAGMKIAAAKEGQEYSIRGKFRSGREYQLKIARVAISVGGKEKEILSATEQKFLAPGPKTEVEIATGRRVVERIGRQLFPLRLQNVDRLETCMRSIPPLLALNPAESIDTAENVIEAYLNLMEPRLTGLAEREDCKPFAPFFQRGTGINRETFHISGTDDRFALPLSFRRNADQGGIFLLQMTAHGAGKPSNAQQVVQVTDLGLHYKFSERRLLLWATSLHDAEPLAGADILLIRKDDGRVMAGKTDSKGLLLLDEDTKLPVLKLADKNPTASQEPLHIADVIAAVTVTDTDCAFIPLSAHRVFVPGIKVVTGPDAKAIACQGRLFTERGVYKPGEPLYFKGCIRVRTDGQVRPPLQDTLAVILKGPDNKEIYRGETGLTEFGTVSGEITVPGFAALGQYRLIVEGIEKRTHKILEKFSISTTLQVQEFEPPRFKVDMSFTTRELERAGFVGTTLPGRVVDVSILPRYYAGGPLRHAKVHWKAELIPSTYSVEGREEYSFGGTDNEELLLESGEGLTDGAGKLLVTIPLDPSQFNGAAALRISATAVDVDGRSASGVDQWQPKPVWRIGVAGPAGPFRVGDMHEFRAIVLDGSGQPAASGKLEVVMMKKDWFYLLKRNSEGELTYSWDEGWTEDYRLDSDLTAGMAAIPVRMNAGGSYRMRLSYGEGDARSAAVHAWEVDWSWSEDYDDPAANEKREVLRARQLAVFADHSTVKPGTDVRFEFRARRPVRWCLVTVEREDILQADVIPVNGSQGEFVLKTDSKHAPNVYVGFTTIAPRGDYPVYGFQLDVDAPHSFHAMEKLTVLTGRPGLKLAIAPSIPTLKSEPGKIVSLTLEVQDPDGKPVEAEVTLVAVDAAVLALTRFLTPDFNGLERFTLPLSVLTGSLLWDLVSQDAFRLLLARPVTGGGGEAGDLLSTMDLRKDFRPVACFLPDLRTAADGTVTATFTLPDTTTTYRVYALACDKGHAFASTERSMLVTKEFFVDPALPRFLVAGDTFRASLSLVNRGEKAGIALLEVAGSGPVELAAERDTITMEAEGRTSVRLHGKALDQGNADLSFASRFEGLTDGMQETRPVLSRRVRVRKFLAGDFRGQETIDLKDALADVARMDPDELAREHPTARLILGRTPWNRIEPALRYLMHYPYGCVEQTSSSLIPLIAIHRLASKGLAPRIDLKDLDTFIRGGIERLARMHISRKGFAYWPGGHEPVYSGTAYALFALTEAQAAGYDVPDGLISEALEWLRKEAFKKTGESIPSWGFPTLAPWVLSRHAKIAAPDLKMLFAEWTKLDLEGNAIFGLTSLVTKALDSKKTARLFRRLNVKKLLTEESYWHRFRAAGLLLYLAVELDDSRALDADWIAGWLLRQLGPEGRWHSTSDTGFCLLALARWLEASQPADDAPLTISLQPAPASLTTITLGTEEVALELALPALLAAENLQIKLDRKELLSWCLQLETPLPDELTDDTGTISLTKEIIPPAGRETIAVGDVVRVRLTFTLPKDGKNRWTDYDYLAIDDPLPAGLVPLNSDLPGEANYTSPDDEQDAYWQDGYYTFRPDHREFRNDRVLAFRDRAWSGQFQFEYWARAVSEGEFWLRPTQIRMMYQPEVFGLLPGRLFTIQPVTE